MNIRSEIEALGIERRAFIGGSFVDTGRELAKECPADGSPISVCACDEKIADEAVRKGREAFEGGAWRYAPVARRKKTVSRLADLMEEHASSERLERAQ